MSPSPQDAARGLLVVLVPIVITIHNLEEALSMPVLIARRNAVLPKILPQLLPPVTYAQFLFALFIMTAVPYFIAWFAARERDGRGAAMFWLLSVQVMMLVNVLAHAVIATLLGGYAPGVVTAVAINLPFSIYLLRRAARERWVSGRAMALTFPTGVILHGTLPLIIILSGKIVNIL